MSTSDAADAPLGAATRQSLSAVIALLAGLAALSALSDQYHPSVISVDRGRTRRDDAPARRNAEQLFYCLRPWAAHCRPAFRPHRPKATRVGGSAVIRGWKHAGRKRRQSQRSGRWPHRAGFWGLRHIGPFPSRRTGPI